MRGKLIQEGRTKVRLYARHKGSCPLRDDNSDTSVCDCIKWMQFQIAGVQRRESTDAWRWSAAEKIAVAKARELEGLAVGEPLPENPTTAITIAEAIKKYLAWRERESESNDKAKLMTAKLQKYCSERSVFYLHQITTPMLSDFKGRLPYKNHMQDSGSLKIHWSMISNFFRWLAGENLLENNPMPSGPQARTKSGKPKVNPFSKSEMEKILAAVDEVEGWDAGRRNTVRTLILLMRWSGLAIRDATCLKRIDMKGNSVITNRKKTGEPVYVPLPKFVADALRNHICNDPDYFFWGNLCLTHYAPDKIKTSTILHSHAKHLRKVFKTAGVKGHPHMLRHTFVTEQLASGTRVEHVADMAGHSPQVCRDTYRKWIKEMQEPIDEAVVSGWLKQGLDREGSPLTVQ
jgi:integrase/recombinase XerD